MPIVLVKANELPSLSPAGFHNFIHSACVQISQAGLVQHPQVPSNRRHVLKERAHTPITRCVLCLELSGAFTLCIVALR